MRRDWVAALFAGVLTVVLLSVVAGVVWFALMWVRGSLARPGTMLPGVPERVGPSENVKYEFGSVLPVWAGTERVTVLLLGIDERAQENGPWRTDTIILLTLDPVAKTGGVLSIPRDLWVPIPGYKENRINTAHFLGDLYGYPGGGPALARETVEYNFGVKIDYYVRVNFQGFVDAVDLIGGIDVYVEKPINDPTYPDEHYGYDPLYIEAGYHHFDGKMALKYVRTRHGSSDFERARRQQQVMLAILDRVTRLDMLPTLARNTPRLREILQQSVQTDMALDQMLALANLATQVDRANIRFGVIDQSCTQPWVTPEGAQVLIPLRDRVRQVRDYVFNVMPAGATPLPGVQAAPTATPEMAAVAVLNGTTMPGLASTTADYLRAKGVDVQRVGNAQRQDYAMSLIIMYRDRPAVATRLVQLLGLAPSAIVNGNDPTAQQEIVVILGADYTGPPSETP